MPWLFALAFSHQLKPTKTLSHTSSLLALAPGCVPASRHTRNLATPTEGQRVFTPSSPFSLAVLLILLLTPLNLVGNTSRPCRRPSLQSSVCGTASRRFQHSGVICSFDTCLRSAFLGVQMYNFEAQSNNLPSLEVHPPVMVETSAIWTNPHHPKS